MVRRTGIVILAAGESRRMGRPKQTLPYQNGTLLTHAVTAALGANADCVVVVLGANADSIRSLLADYPVSCVDNFDWQEGMNTSIRAGIVWLEEQNPTVEAVVLLTCDQPFLSADIVRALILKQAILSKTLVASEYAGTVGIPAIFDKSLFAQLKTLPSGAGAKRLIAGQPPEKIGTISFDALRVDIDTPEDYARLMGNRSLQDPAILCNPRGDNL